VSAPRRSFDKRVWLTQLTALSSASFEKAYSSFPVALPLALVWVVSVTITPPLIELFTPPRPTAF
jgi:hypothetical protein